MEKKVKAVLFDFDGTLMDTNELIIGSWQSVFKTITGKEAPREKIIGSFGETLWYTMGRFFPDEDTEKCIDIYRTWQSDKYLDAIEMFPGMEKLVRDLHEKGYRLAIVTSRIKSSLEMGLDKFGLRDIFEVVVTCDDTEAHKPSPIPAQIALERLGIGPDEAIMVGDTKFDTGCANNAGITSIQVSWTYGSDLTEADDAVYRPDYTITKAEDFWEVLAAL